MEQVDQGDEAIADAKQPEIAVCQVPARVPGEDEERKRDRDGDDLDEAVEQEIAVEAAEVQPQGDGRDGPDVGEFLGLAAVEHLEFLFAPEKLGARLRA